MRLFQNLYTGLAAEVVYFSILSPGGHFVGGQSPKEHSCKIISKSMHWLRRRSHLNVFLFLAMAAILFNGAERFEQFW